MLGIFTASGFWDLEHPESNNVRAIDIAWALSNINRFTGHTSRPWSVLNHSMLVAGLAFQHRKGQLTTTEKLCLLLHDSQEAFVGDVVSPLKKLLPGYKAVEEPTAAHIMQRFGVSPDQQSECAQLVHTYDMQALYVEVHYLFRPEAERDYNYKQYDMELTEKCLVNYSVENYLNVLRDLSRDNNVQNIQDLFYVPPHLNIASVQQAPRVQQRQANPEQFKDTSIPASEIKQRAKIIEDDEDTSFRARPDRSLYNERI